MLDAFSSIAGNLLVVVVGDPRTDPEYAAELGHSADSRVHFIPFIADRAELFGIISGAQFFVFPSTIEAMSMVLLEASSLGVPIVCSDIPANLAVLPEQALHFRCGDIDDLRQKLAWAIAHAAEMRELGLRAQAWVRQCFSWDHIAEQYDILYESTVPSGREDDQVSKREIPSYNP